MRSLGLRTRRRLDVYTTINKTYLAKLAFGAAVALLLTIVPANVPGRYTHR